MAAYKHIKRGSTYQKLHVGKIQTAKPLNDYDNVVVYQSDADGSIWVRPVEEFEERFEEIVDEIPTGN